MSRMIPHGLLPVSGLQVMSLSNTTAVALNSTCKVGNALIISVEDVDARFRADGTAPQNNTGVVLFSGSTYMFEGFNCTSKLKLCRKGTTGTSKVSIFAYKLNP